MKYVYTVRVELTGEIDVENAADLPDEMSRELKAVSASINVLGDATVTGVEVKQC